MRAKFILLLLIMPILAMAGNVVIKGKVVDKTTGEPLPSATIYLTSYSDGDYNKYTSTDIDGNFSFSSLKDGSYLINVTYVGYKSDKKKLKVSGGKSLYEVSFSLDEDAMMLGEVSVQGRATRAEQKGDSLLYNAEAFKVMVGSSAEDLLSKMPGVVVEGGSVQAQGEDVKKILVDGKEFFEGDINLALKNLPSDVITGIEIFDKKSEQAEFTGFDDGDEIKTINIITKGGFRQGTFGEVSGGYGTEDRYKVNGNINIFNGDRRISVLGMSNNVNQQNFSQEDLAGVMSSSSQGRGPGGGGRKGGSFGGGGIKGGMGGGNNASDFMVGSMGGVTSTNGVGLNYVDKWGDKVNFTGSYFLNQSDNLTKQQTQREFFESVLPGMTYDEYKENNMNNWNHRLNFKFDYKISDRTSLMFRPTFSFQNNNNLSFMQGENFLRNELDSETQNNTNSDNTAYNVGAELVLRHKFPVEGRTLSLMFNGKMSNTDGDTYTDYINTLNILSGTPQTEEYSQYKDVFNRQYNIRTNLMYTEKVMDEMQLMLGYKFSYSDSEADKKTYIKSPVTDLYDQLDESLSNVYQSGYTTHAGNVGLMYHKNKFNAMIGTDVQWSALNGDLTYPSLSNIDNHYVSVLPMLNMKYSIDRANSFMLRYRSFSSSPSVTDLQNVIDNSNPLYISSGNPELDQQISHSLNLRYIHTTKNGHTFIAMLGGTAKQNYIADSTFVAKEDIKLSETVTLNKGSQFTKPVNMDGYYSLQSMFTYGFPFDAIRSNINLSISANYANVPTIFDGVESKTNELNIIPKVIIGSNISQNLDFTASYSAGINKIFNSQDTSVTGDYITHNASAKLGWTFFWGLTFRSTFNYIGYSGLESGNEDYFLWNVSLGKKFLKNNAAEIKVEAFDVLKQNQAFTHVTGSNYYDYVSSNVLQPYAMVSFIYTIR